MGNDESQHSKGGHAERSEPTGLSLLELSDDALLSQCSVDTYRASGPGGQKRNKTSSAVRLRHQQTGLIVTAVESRSQHENRSRAIRRLREAIALNQRDEIDPRSEHPVFFNEAIQRDATLRVNRKHPDYWRIVHYVLDVLHLHHARVSEAASFLELTTGHLVRFLKNDPQLWEHANRMRAHFEHPPLK
jgi:hypothetical protein